MIESSLLYDVFATFNKLDPNPGIELRYTNEFTFLIAVVLSARTTDVQVNKVTDELFKVIKTPEDVIEMGLDEFSKQIKSIGLYKSKAKNILSLSETLIKYHNSVIPCDLAQLTSLPGVGIKSAKVFLNLIKEEPVVAVDTHVLRVSNRIGMVNSQSLKVVESTLEKTVPKEFLLNAHRWLVLHGRYICRAKKPKCQECCISQMCEYYSHNSSKDDTKK